MKTILVCLLFILGFGTTRLWMDVENEATPLYEEYVEESKNIYDVYYEFKKEVDENHTYSIIVGEYKNELYFDIFYYQVGGIINPIRIDIGEEEYEVPNVDSNHYKAHMIQNKNNEVTTVYLFDGLSQINPITIPTDYSTISSVSLVGEGKGGELTYLEPIVLADKTQILIILISLIVCFGGIIAIGVFYIFKVGKFKVKPQKLEKVRNPVIYYSNPANLNTNKDEDIELEVITSDDPVKTDIKATYHENDSLYNQDSHIDCRYSNIVGQEEEETKEVDIKALLLMKGYKTDYSTMTEEEKNEVMVYLMILRKQNQISSEQYQKEVVSLWKQN